MKTLETYLERLAKIRSDSSRRKWPANTYHRAPHKPLLLLTVMDLIAEKTVTANLIEVTPELGELFTLYWARVMPPDQQGNLALPFFHLTRDGLLAFAAATRQRSNCRGHFPNPVRQSIARVGGWRAIG